MSSPHATISHLNSIRDRTSLCHNGRLHPLWTSTVILSQQMVTRREVPSFGVLLALLNLLLLTFNGVFHCGGF